MKKPKLPSEKDSNPTKSNSPLDELKIQKIFISSIRAMPNAGRSSSLVGSQVVLDDVQGWSLLAEVLDDNA
jgi:hypothetical protein